MKKKKMLRKKVTPCFKKQKHTFLLSHFFLKGGLFATVETPGRRRMPSPGRNTTPGTGNKKKAKKIPRQKKQKEPNKRIQETSLAQRENKVFLFFVFRFFFWFSFPIIYFF